MPFCPKCGYEYEEGKKMCPDCRVKLVDEEPRESFIDEEFVPVFYSAGEIEAEIVKGVLQEAGIPVLERGDTEDEAFKFTVGPLGEEELLVPESRLDEAKAVISDAIEKGQQLPEEVE